MLANNVGGLIKKCSLKMLNKKQFVQTSVISRLASTSIDKSDITENKGNNNGNLNYNPLRFSSNPLPQIFSPFVSPFLEDFFNAAPTLFPTSACSQVLPKISACESEKEFHIEAEVPGIDKKHIKLKVIDDILSIQAVKKTNHHSKHEDKNVIWHFEETSNAVMRRAFKLPSNVKSDEIKAKLLDGILSITIPKEEHHDDQEEHHIKKKFVHID